MVFIVQFEDIYEDQSERLLKRQQHMPAHLAFLAQHSDKVVAFGAIRDSQEGTPLGGIWIVNAPDQATVETFYQSNPFGWLTYAALSASTIGERPSGRPVSSTA